MYVIEKISRLIAGSGTLRTPPWLRVWTGLWTLV